MSKLSYGIIDAILERKDSVNEDDNAEKPIVQILASKIMPANNRIRAVIYDGQRIFQYCLFVSPDIDQHFNRGDLDKYTIISLKKYSLSSLPKKEDIPIILVNEMEILKRGDKVQHQLEKDETFTVKKDDDDDTSECDQKVKRTSLNNIDDNNNDIDKSNNDNNTHSNKKSKLNDSSISKQNIDNGENFSAVPINVLTPFFNAWIIRGLCIHKSQIRQFNNARGPGRLFNFDVSDETGEIQILCFNQECDRFYGIVEVNRVYYIGHGMIRSANRKFSSINNDYSITLTQASFVKPCTNNNIERPKTQYKFKPISLIMGLAENSIIDVIGVIRSIDDPIKIMNKKTMCDSWKRDVYIVDKSLHCVRVTLWGENAKNFAGQLERVLLLKGCVVREYNGKYISTRDSTHILLDPEIPETNLLRIWYDSLDQNTIEFHNLATTMAYDQNKTNDNFKYIGTIKSIKLDEKINYHTIATVMNINGTRFHFYKSCDNQDDNCKKKVIENDDNTYICTKCNKISANYQWRMIMSLHLTDVTGSLWATLFQDQIESVLKKSTKELVEIYLTNETLYEKIINETFRYHQFQFKIQSKLDSTNDETYLRNIIFQIDQIKGNNNQLKKMINMIDKIEKI